MRTILLLVVFAAFCGCSTRQQPSVTTTSKPQAAPPDPIDQLVARLSSPAYNQHWVNGTYPPVNLPATASPEEVIRQVFAKIGFHNGTVHRHEILETRQVRIPGGAPSHVYTAVLVETNLGRMIVLLQPESPTFWWSQVHGE